MFRTAADDLLKDHKLRLNSLCAVQVIYYISFKIPTEIIHFIFIILLEKDWKKIEHKISKKIYSFLKFWSIIQNSYISNVMFVFSTGIYIPD